MHDNVFIDVPFYGTVKGNSLAEGVECYLGIPYAKINKRWTKPERAAPFPGGQHDGTRHGPMCPQLKSAVSITQVAVPGYPHNPSVPEDEFACLNLNITRPSGTKGRLPVMVWIHGGAFSVGSNSERVYDGVEFVVQSVKIRQPVLYVAINYRLGIFGFLASQELLEESNNQSVGNYALKDQSAALEFIHETVEAFGGDRDRITLFGESAGSASVHSQMLHGKALFDRAICQSGVTNTVGPLPLKSIFHQGLFDAVQTKLNVNGVQQLRATSPAKLLEAMQALYPELPVFFILDDSHLTEGFFPAGTKWNSVPQFCKALLLGYCDNEGIIMAKSLASIRPSVLKSCLQGSGISTDVLQSYGLDEILSKDYNTVIPALIDFQSDLAFKGPTESVKANAPADSLFVYRFERQNKWAPGPFTGVAHHTIDLLYLAGVPRHYDTEEPVTDRMISEEMISAWIKFGNGEKPWTAYAENQTELVFGRDGSMNTVVRENKHRSVNLSKLQNEIDNNLESVLRLNAVLSNGAIRY